MCALHQKTSDAQIIDIRSDTLTFLTDEMKQAMVNADVGDDVWGEDPTVHELERRAAEMTGKEAALFTPTGMMSNLIAVMVHCDKRGSEVMLGNWSHILKYEQGCVAQIASVTTHWLQNLPDGTFSIDEMRRNVKRGDIFDSVTQLVAIEQTHNMTGGKVLPLDWIENLSKACRENNLKLHMDGARVFNAAEHLKVPVGRVVRDVDSVSFCLSKSLCCPMGSLLCGTKQFVDTARRLRKALGGGMRQVGYLAAAGLCAFDTIVPTLGNDHRHTRQLAEAIDGLKSSIFKVDLNGLHSNILMVGIDKDPKKLSAYDLCNRLIEIKDDEVASGICNGAKKPLVIKTSIKDDSTLRIIFYHQIDDEATQLAIKKIIFVMKEFEKQF